MVVQYTYRGYLGYTQRVHGSDTRYLPYQIQESLPYQIQELLHSSGSIVGGSIRNYLCEVPTSVKTDIDIVCGDWRLTAQNIYDRFRTSYMQRVYHACVVDRKNYANIPSLQDTSLQIYQGDVKVADIMFVKPGITVTDVLGDFDLDINQCAIVPSTTHDAPMLVHTKAFIEAYHSKFVSINPYASIKTSNDRQFIESRLHDILNKLNTPTPKYTCRAAKYYQVQKGTRFSAIVKANDKGGDTSKKYWYPLGTTRHPQSYRELQIESPFLGHTEVEEQPTTLSDRRAYIEAFNRYIESRPGYINTTNIWTV